MRTDNEAASVNSRNPSNSSWGVYKDIYNEEIWSRSKPPELL
jgi:hypothetical protein